MKKSLLAVAAMGAFASAAQAQSSVTVYGILDVGYTNGSARFSTATTTVKQNVSRIGNSMESGSRLGFRGNEDLGGGLSAQFVAEFGLQPAGNAGSNFNGTKPSITGTTTDGNYGSTSWQPNTRQAYVGFTKAGLVDVRVGTQNTFNWEQAGSNTTGQLAQTLGSMLAPTTDGAFYNSAALPSTVTSASSLNGAALGAFTNRTTNTITIRTQRMAGLVAKAGLVLSNQVDTQTSATAGGNSNQYGWMGALDYVYGKANVQASYQVFQSELPQGTGGNYTTTPSAWGSGTQGNNVVDGQALITASYDFGILKAYAGWVNRKLEQGNNSNNFLKRSAQEIGVRSFITPTIEGWASIGNGRYQAFGSSNPTANITGWQLGGNYYLSKRTNLYTIYGQNQTSSTTIGSAAASQFSVGARHTF